MKSFDEFQEALSMKDLKQIKGGTDAQRKIAQDRQKAREAKNRGFDPKKEVLKDKPGALAKRDSSEISKSGSSEVRKPDLRKSQLGKWSQGVKNSPGKLAKKAGTELAKKVASSIVKRDDIKNVDVKDNGPVAKDEKQAGERPGTTKNKTVINNVTNIKQKKEKKSKGLMKRALGHLKKYAKDSVKDGSGPSTSGDLQGLTGRNKGLVG